MRSFLFPLMFSLLFSVSVKGQPMQATQPTPPSADEILKEAKETAAKEGKNIFIMFHASWCGWCHKMDASMNDPVCKKFFEDNFVIRHMVVDESKGKENLENPGAVEFRIKYHGEGQGIPFWLIFDKDGKLLSDSKTRTATQGPSEGQNIGCPASEDEVGFFVSILKKTSQLSPQQEEAVVKRFRQNQQ